MLLLFLLPVLTLTRTSLADQAVINAANSALHSQLSSLSSLFTAEPSPATTTDRFCCADTCPPGARNINNIVPTDLGYAFPAPSSTPPLPSSELKLPCCGSHCPDGGCRTTPIKSSVRPVQTRPPRHGSQSQNIIIGCCSTCHACGQFVTSVPAKSLASTTAEPEITASPSLEDAVGKHPEQKFPGSGQGPLFPDICIGCGKCTPCDRVRLATWVDFFPTPTANSDDAAATTTTASPTPTPDSAKVQDSKETPDPTIYLANDVVEAINGQNQDYVPIILQTGGTPSGILRAGTKELRTLLAAVDLKLSENYISRRLIKHLSRLDDIIPYPAGVSQNTAVISQNLDTVTVNASIVLNIVAGDGADNTRKLFRNVRFNVYGSVDDVITSEGVSEVILGSKVLREMNGLSVFSGFRGGVQEGVRVVEVAHWGQQEGGKEGVLGGGAEGREGHDEL